MVEKIIVVMLVVALITGIYKLLPFRNAGSKKPYLAIFPKYKNSVEIPFSSEILEKKLSEYGFKKTKEKGGIIYFTRGFILGDLSVKLSKVKLTAKEISQNLTVLTIEAGWVAGFDTGDHWKLLKELSNKLENA